MGQNFSSIFSWQSLFFSAKECKIIMVGLDAAGKTTILFNLSLSEVLTTIPTIGFNVQSIQYKNLVFNVWDIGGQDKIRKLWRHYYDNNQGIIFVVDSCDSDRLDQAKEELHMMLNEDQLRDAALLVYANKQDLPNALSVSEIADGLELRNIKNRKWFVQPSCGRTKEGLYEGLEWLSKAVL